MKSIYVASRFLNYDAVIEFQNRLTEKGWNISFDWASLGKDLHQKNPNCYNQNNTSELANAELDAVKNSDVLLLMAPCHLLPPKIGAYVEMGCAIGNNKPVIVWCSEDRDVLFFLHKNVTLVRTEEEVWEKLGEYN